MKGGHELVGVGAQVHARFLRAENRLVVHVGEVDDLPHVVAQEIFEGTPEHIDADKRPEVADVAARIDREPARVQAHRVACRRRKALFAAREGVVEAHAFGPLSYGHRTRRAPVAAVLRERDLDLAGMRREAHRVAGAGRLAVFVHHLIEQAIARLASDAAMGKDGSEKIGKDMRVGRTAGERHSESEFWGGHEGRFYSERRSNSTRARPQSAAICVLSASTESNARSSRSRCTNARRIDIP